MERHEQAQSGRGTAGTCVRKVHNNLIYVAQYQWIRTHRVVLQGDAGAGGCNDSLLLVLASLPRFKHHVSLRVGASNHKPEVSSRQDARAIDQHNARHGCKGASHHSQLRLGVN